MNTTPSPSAPRCVFLLCIVLVLVLVLVDVLVLVLGDVEGGDDDDAGAGAAAAGFSGGIGSPSGSGTGCRVAGTAPGGGCGITSPGEVGHGTGSFLSSPQAERASASCT